MAIEPQVFTCYGRPDKDAAHALACEFWKILIESTFNELAPPVSPTEHWYDSQDFFHSDLHVSCQAFSGTPQGS